MAAPDDSGRSPPRKRLHLFVPDETADLGLEEIEAKVRPDRELKAVVVELRALDAELVLFPDSAVNFVLAMVGAISRLRGNGTP
jgi:hypothetical protein